VLLPSNDDLAWLFARERERLGQVFQTCSPAAAAMAALLDKRRLHQAAVAAGLETPETWCPSGQEEVAALAPHLPYPILLKPRTQVFSCAPSKGVRIDAPGDLAPAYRAFVALAGHLGAVEGRIPDTDRPMLQAYHRGAGDRIYEISGFIDQGGEGLVARAATKVVQRPRRMGIGLCFEEAPLDEGLLARVGRLCREVGFHGIFNVEFLMSERRPLLIDFNPRSYNQMAFDVARGLPLPWLAYLDATGQRAALRDELDRARAWRGPSHVFCNRFSTILLLNAQVLVGAIAPAEKERWRRWYEEHRAQAIDPVVDLRDWRPMVLDVAHQIFDTARHARHFVRQLRLGEGAALVLPLLPSQGPLLRSQPP
jgi:predicted ATP-grasp superfamily ATP-dependent carboligase